MTSLNNQFWEEGFEVAKIVIEVSKDFGSQRAINEAIKLCIQEFTDVEVRIETKKGIEIHHISFEKIFQTITVEKQTFKGENDQSNTDQ